MKVLAMSDTHGFINNARAAIAKNPDIELVLHLGDYFRDAVQLSQLYPNVKFEYVYGNCDFGIDGTPADKIIEIAGKKIFITHGHRYSVKWDYNRIVSRAEEEGASAILFGHTHVATVDMERNILIVNPGSMSESRSNDSESYAILDISANDINADILYI